MELGIWQGIYQGVELPWMRWWDAEGNLLLAADERAEQAELAVEQAQSEAEQERQRRIEAEQRIQALEARLRELEGG